jgi:type IV pilus assembly protein PilY1
MKLCLGNFAPSRDNMAALVAIAAMLLTPVAHGEDIDLFVTNVASGSLAAPNVMILVDNSSNWSRSAQQWPDNGGKQGQAELQALRNVISGITTPANLGLAGFTGSGSSVGGYVRFGIRDMTVAANKSAVLKVLDLMKSDINSASEKVNDNAEAAGMYEMYKYFKGMPVFRGGKVSGNDPAANVDMSGNAGIPANSDATAFAAGLRSGFAISGSNYQTPTSDSSCGRNDLILIINNAQGSIPTGNQTYESTSAGSSLPVLAGVSDISWTDEWARFLYNNGISVYILDAYYAQQNVSHSAVLQRAARVGGGEYYAVKNQSDIELAIKRILADMNAVNTTFAAASLPISATNRSQNLNQVFIGMFRPDAGSKPRWMGNLKQYQLARTTSGVDLVDRLGTNAVNSQTGFLSECAASLWTTDSGSYWENVYANNLAQSGCTVFPSVNGVAGSKWSDMPDGPTVEKGGVAEGLRKGNNPPSTDTAPTYLSNRTILTFSTSAASKLEPLTTAQTGWSQGLLDWVKGSDDATAVTVDGVTSRPFSEFTDTTSVTSARTRPAIHGDVIHSRPLPVNYGGGGVTVYYGSNDGMLRAVNASNGKERWAFVAPEHYTKYQRLHDNTKLINFHHVDAALNPTPKDYFFDGSMGLYQNADSSKVWIFPTQRRGGRMLYGFDVTNPDSPILKWRVGCTTAAPDNTGCTSADMSSMGQSWSLPNVAFLKGHSTSIPVIIVGGGYDTCEDTDSETTTCEAVNGSRKSGVIYVLNADTGAVVKKFEPSDAGRFVADIALADANGDGSVDYAYAADTRGNIYRLDFSHATSPSTGEESLMPRGESHWKIRKVAYTTGAGRKFQYHPALLRVGDLMYVALGSGDRERPLLRNYPYARSITNRYYVFMDDLNAQTGTLALDTDPLMKNYTTLASTSCTEPGVTPTSGFKGWFMDMPYRGEQVVTSSLIAAGSVAFNTHRALDGAVNACASPLGEARGYWLNLANASGSIAAGNKTCGGDRSSVFVGGGLTPSPTLARVVINGTTTTVVIGAASKDGTPSITIDPNEVKPAVDSRRRTIYWKSNSAD